MSASNETEAGLKPTPLELARLALEMWPDGMRQGQVAEWEKMLSRAYSLWRSANGVIARDGTIEPSEIDQEEARLRAEAALFDAAQESRGLAEKEPNRVVAFTDAMLWAAIGEGPRSKFEKPGQVAERIYKKYVARMKADGREAEIRRQSEGINLGFAISYLAGERKRGPVPTTNSDIAGNQAEESQPKEKDSDQSEVSSQTGRVA